MESALLRLSDITHRYSGTPALTDIELSVDEGDIVGIVGENGAGKSTLVKIIAGIIQPSEGRIFLDGEEVHVTPQTQERLGISIVPQHLEVFPYLTVAENMFMPDLPRYGGLVDYNKLLADARAWIDQFDLGIDPRANMEDLSFVDQKAVSILKALKRRSRIVILDEPTASLYLEEIQQLFRMIREFNSRGVTFIYISHHLEEIFQICNRVAVLRDGKMQGYYAVDEIDLRTLVTAMVGSEVSNLTRSRSRVETREIALSISGLWGERVLRDFNLDVHAGEIVGILSSKGGGKEELVGELFGFSRKGGGTVTCAGTRLKNRTPKLCFEQGLFLLPEDRHSEGLFLSKSIRENMTVCSLSSVTGRYGFLQRSAERRVVERNVQALSIAAKTGEQLLQYLSGGNQQKVVFSKILEARPRILVLDSPTVGVDIRSRFEIHRHTERIAADGIAVILITSDLDEILALSDRIIVLAKGVVTRTLQSDDEQFNRHDLGLLMEGAAI